MAINNNRIVVVTPAGRRRYLEILAPYVLGSRRVTVWELWANTEDEVDLDWMDALAAREPRVKVVRGTWPWNGNASIGPYFMGATDPKCVYVRLDDDVVWTSPGAIEHLADYRVAHPEPFLVYGGTVNSALTSWLYQRLGRVGTEHGVCRYEVLDKVGWEDPAFAVHLHRRFLADPVAGSWRLPRWDLLDYERHSINVISWLGSDAVRWAGEVGGDEEQYLSVVRPRQEERPCRIVDGPLFVHYAFYPQRLGVDNAPDVLSGYRKLAGLS